jgi:hypothetical protein
VRFRFAHRLAFQIDLCAAINTTVQNSIRNGGVADVIVPGTPGHLPYDVVPQRLRCTTRPATGFDLRALLVRLQGSVKIIVRFSPRSGYLRP